MVAADQLQIAVNIGFHKSRAKTPTATAAARAYCDLHIENVKRLMSGFSGVMTSLFLTSPTGVQNPRKVDLGMNISF